jgi:hypothetical protein
MAEEIDKAIQQAAQPTRHFMGCYPQTIVARVLAFRVYHNLLAQHLAL